MWRKLENSRRDGQGSPAVRGGVMTDPSHARPRIGLAALLLLVLLIPHAAAQTPSEHEQHHPPPSPTAPTNQPPSPSMPSQPESPMSGMMRLPPLPPQALYPSLMALPELTPEVRAQLEALANERLRTGTALMLTAVERLTAAAGNNDPSAMQAAASEIREGLAQIETAAGTRRALAARRAPRDIALDWFRREMSLVPPAAAPMPRGPLGLTWFHTISMLILVAFAVTMVTFYFHKMRRAAALLTALAKEPGPASGGTAPPADEGSGGLPVGVSRPAPPQTAPPADRADARPAVWSGLPRVVAIVPETSDVTAFRLAMPDSGELPFRHFPGQYVNLFVDIDGKVTRRAYTIASSPTHPQYIEITAKREPFGVASGHLHERIQMGDALRIEGPHGYFVFTGSEADSVVLIGGKAGITPLMSIIRYLTHQAWRGDIVLLYACKTASDVICRDELASLQRRHPNLHVVTTLTREEMLGMRTGRVTAALLAEFVSDIATRRVHICGPRPMIDAVKQMLAEAGVRPAQITTENFGTETRSPAAAAMRAVPPSPPDASPPALPGHVAAVRSTHTISTAPTVTFARSQKTVPAIRENTVLDVAEVAGLEIDSACPSGTCGSCKVRLRSGDVTMEVDDALEPEDRAVNVILACQAKPSSDVVVEA